MSSLYNLDKNCSYKLRDRNIPLIILSSIVTQAKAAANRNAFSCVWKEMRVATDLQFSGGVFQILVLGTESKAFPDDLRDLDGLWQAAHKIIAYMYLF